MTKEHTVATIIPRQLNEAMQQTGVRFGLDRHLAEQLILRVAELYGTLSFEDSMEQAIRESVLSGPQRELYREVMGFYFGVRRAVTSGD